MKTRHFTSVIGAALSLLAGQANATTVTANVSLDVGDVVPGLFGFTGGAQGAPPFTPAYSVDIAEGDTFDFTMDFVGTQTLTINNLSFIWAFSYATTSSNVEGTGSLTFLDAGGVPIFTSISKTDTEGAVHFGQFFYNPADLSGLSDPITFGGLHYVGTINDYIEPGVTSRTYNNPAFFFNADGFTTASVPDASATALLLAAGLAPMLAMRRRRA